MGFIHSFHSFALHLLIFSLSLTHTRMHARMHAHTQNYRAQESTVRFGNAAKCLDLCVCVYRHTMACEPLCTWGSLYVGHWDLGLCAWGPERVCPQDVGVCREG